MSTPLGLYWLIGYSNFSGIMGKVTHALPGCVKNGVRDGWRDLVLLLSHGYRMRKSAGKSGFALERSLQKFTSRPINTSHVILALPIN